MLAMSIGVRETSDGVEFEIRVVPRAAKTEIVGQMDGALKVRISAPPVDGAANAELVKLFAKTLGVARSNVEIVSGLASKAKLIRVMGVTAEAVRDALG